MLAATAGANGSGCSGGGGVEYNRKENPIDGIPAALITNYSLVHQLLVKVLDRC